MLGTAGAGKQGWVRHRDARVFESSEGRLCADNATPLPLALHAGLCGLTERVEALEARLDAAREGETLSGGVRSGAGEVEA